MSTFHRYVLGVLACLIVLVVFQFAPAQKDAAKSVQKWEYTTSAPFPQQMNEYGEEGWELVCVSQTRPDHAGQAYFKRPKE